LLSFSGAKKITPEQDAELFNVVEEMAIAGGIPMPAIYLINSPAMNAFATGRDPANAAVAITKGLRERLSRDELQAVMAHEVAHILNFDIRLSMMIAVFCGIIVIVSRGLIHSQRGSRRATSGNGKGNAAIGIILVALAVISPIISNLIRFSVSRQREYLADATAVRLTRNPSGLASALKKLTEDTQPLEASNGAMEHLYIVNPLHKGLSADKDSIWSTHPPVSRRVQRILALTKEKLI